MSNVALDWAKEQRVGSPTRKAVLLVLADAANDRGTAWLSHRTLAETVEASRDTVKRALRDLQSAGLVTRRARTRANGSETSSYWDLALLNTPGGDAARTPGGDATCPSPEPSLDPSFPTGRTGCLNDLAGDPAMTTASTTPDPDQLGLDGMPDAPPPKPRKVNGPQAVLEAYEAAYIGEHGKPSLRPPGRTRSEAKRLLASGETLEDVVAAAESLARGGNVFHSIVDERRILRAQEERADRAHAGAVEGWSHVTRETFDADRVYG